MCPLAASMSIGFRRFATWRCHDSLTTVRTSDDDGAQHKDDDLKFESTKGKVKCLVVFFKGADGPPH
jgi:hypothetical protein